MKYVNQPVRKTDAMSLVTGKPVYTDDLAPKDCLIVKVLRSPHANAWVEDIKTGTAEKVAGIACVPTDFRMYSAQISVLPFCKLSIRPLT